MVADPRQTEALYGLGLVHKRLQKLSRAEEYYLKALELEPVHQDTILDLGHLYYTQKNFTEVIKVLKRLPQSLLFTAPDYVQAGSMLVNSHLQLGHANEAEEIFKIMLVADSLKLRVNALNGLGNAISTIIIDILI